MVVIWNLPVLAKELDRQRAATYRRRCLILFIFLVIREFCWPRMENSLATSLCRWLVHIDVETRAPRRWQDARVVGERSAASQVRGAQRRRWEDGSAAGRRMGALQVAGRARRGWKVEGCAFQGDRQFQPPIFMTP